MTTVLRAKTLAQALDILSRPLLIQLTAGGPPPQRLPHATLLDVSPIAAMSGLQWAGGLLRIGLNTTYATLQASSLLRPAAWALVDACHIQEAQTPGGALIHDLSQPAPLNSILLALTLLDARMEIAQPGQEDAISTRELPLTDYLQTDFSHPTLPLAILFQATPSTAASALMSMHNIDPLQPDAWAAAAWVHLDDRGRVENVRIALSPGEGWPQACHLPATDLRGKSPDRATIEAAVRLAQRMCPQPPWSTQPYFFALSAHLMRSTLDRAIARAQAHAFPTALSF